MRSVVDVGCIFEGCPRGRHCKGYCKAHYEQQRRGYELRPLLETISTTCRVDGCARDVGVRRDRLCLKHYEHKRRGVLDGIPLRECINCGQSFVPFKRSDAEACSERCACENARLKATYGITGSGLRSLLVAQRNACAICGDSIKRGGAGAGGLHIDHDHTTGKVRALLCSYCNKGIGNFKDDPTRLAAAIAYLQR